MFKIISRKLSENSIFLFLYFYFLKYLLIISFFFSKTKIENNSRFHAIGCFQFHTGSTYRAILISRKLISETIFCAVWWRFHLFECSSTLDNVETSTAP